MKASDQSSLRLFFASALALDPAFLRVADILTRDHQIETHVIAPETATLTPINQAERRSPDYLAEHYPALNVHFLRPAPGGVERNGFEPASFLELVESVPPTHVWIHAEFWQGISHQFLKKYRLRRSPRIISHVEVNHLHERTPIFGSRFPFLRRTRLTQDFLWPRLDGVSACGSLSRECAYRIGLPARVPVVVNYLPTFGLEAASVPLALPWAGEDAFIVGFVGLLSEQKGWRVLLDALERLPTRFKVVVIGTGDQAGALAERAAAMGDRVFCPGLVARSNVLATYPKFHAVVLPSITRPSSVEQFGMVLAEAMAASVPAIGSDSGAIPELIGDAGIVVPEGNAEQLAAAILRVSDEPALRERVVAAGRTRHRLLFSCEAYAASMASLLKIGSVHA